MLSNTYKTAFNEIKQAVEAFNFKVNGTDFPIKISWPQRASCFFFNYEAFLVPLRIKLKMKTNTIEPINAGIIAKSATDGPQSPRINEPNHAPTKPAMMLPTIPNGTSRPIIIPANQPMIPPIINDHKNPIIYFLLE